MRRVALLLAGLAGAVSALVLALALVLWAPIAGPSSTGVDVARPMASVERPDLPGPPGTLDEPGPRPSGPGCANCWT